MATLSNNICVKFVPVEYTRLLYAMSQRSWIPNFTKYICDLTDLNFRSHTRRYCVDIGLHHIPACYLSYRRNTEEELRPLIIRRILWCLGKKFEHQRMDRRQYIDIYWDNIDSCKFLSSKICSILAVFNHFVSYCINSTNST